MPITGPNRNPTDNVRYSEFIICEGLVFKPKLVESFHHEAISEIDGLTVVNVKSFRHEIKDPDRRLFDYLVSCAHPMPPDEPC